MQVKAITTGSINLGPRQIAIVIDGVDKEEKGPHAGGDASEVFITGRIDGALAEMYKFTNGKVSVAETSIQTFDSKKSTIISKIIERLKTSDSNGKNQKEKFTSEEFSLITRKKLVFENEAERTELIKLLQEDRFKESHYAFHIGLSPGIKLISGKNPDANLVTWAEQNKDHYFAKAILN